MGGTIGPHQAGAVEREHHRQILQSHVVNELVVATLQESGVDRHHRLQAFAGQTGCKGDCMLLCNADVEVARREAALELDHSRTLPHGGRDAHQARVGRRHVAKPFPEHLRERGLGGRGRLRQAHGGVEGARPVVGHRIGLGELVALPFFRDHVEELRPAVGVEQVADVLQRGNERIEVVAVDGADVVETKFLKQRGGHHHAFGVLFQPLGQLEQGRRPLEHLLAHVFRGRIKLPAHELGQVAVERSHRWRDRHVVVIEHHKQATLGHARVVQRLERHACGHGTVADDGHGLALLTLDLGGQRHAQRGRDAGGRMCGAEGVVFALVTARETTDAAELAQGAHAVAPTGEDLVRVGLMTDVPDQAVFRRVEHVVQRQRELHRAKVGTEVAPGSGDAFEEEGAQLVGQRGELRAREAAHVLRRFDRGQQ